MHLVADMERFGLIRRPPPGAVHRETETKCSARLLGGPVTPGTAATMHAQAEGVPFIIEELARAYRDAGMIQEVDGCGRSRQRRQASSRPRSGR